MRRPTAAIVTLFVMLSAVVFVRSRDPESGSRERADAERTAAAIVFFENKLAADPIDAGAASALASRYVRRFQQFADLEDLHRAQYVLAATLPFAGDAAEANAAISSVRLMQHDFTGAWDAALAARNAAGRPAAAYGAWFDAALATGRFAAADSALAAMDPDNLGTRVRQTHWLDAQGDTEAAAEMMSGVCEQLERSGARPEERAWCLTELAGLVQSIEGRTAAEHVLHRALRALPNYRGAIESLADLAHIAGEWERAIRHYERIAVDAHPDLYLRLAEANREIGAESEAEHWEREFVRATGDDSVEALFAHPLALYLARNPETSERALHIAKRDVARRPAPESFDVLAWVHFQRGDLEAARIASDRAVESGYLSPTMLYRRARILAALGEANAVGPLMRTVLLERDQLDPEVRLELDAFSRRAH